LNPSKQSPAPFSDHKLSSEQLAQALQQTMLVDRYSLQRAWREMSGQQNVSAKVMQQWLQKLQKSQQRFLHRQQQLPQPIYPEELPVSARKDEIAQAIRQHQVVIVCGETGSGKTTQLPKICLELGLGVAGMIGHTQPRRIAARSVASRIAQELDSPLGEVVGYKVRFNDKLSEHSYVKLMTDGILLAETQHDRFLNAYDTIIIDEAHERSLNIDFLLGYLKQLLPKRPDLKVIVTSATIDAERFSQHFNQAPVIEVSGRTYPVEIRYRPLGKAGFIAQEIEEDLLEDDDSLYGIKRRGKTEARWLEEDDSEEAIEEAILDAADDLLRQGDGDILVFLPGEREIRDTAEHLRKYQGRSAKLRHIEILPLFARLSVEDQQKIFRPHGSRRIVLATNVAETSLTVPGIRYVIDTGLARINRYSSRAKVEQLQIEKISQAAAKQRAGRCGRVSEGICVRLYDEQDFLQRPAFTDPEILRSSLAAVVLRMAALRLGDVADFPFIEPPSSRLINDGYQLLQELGAVDAQRHITEMGKQLSRLPIDPRLGRMIVAGEQQGVLHEVLVIVSALSIQDPRERPMDKREAADQAHAKFAHERSDFLSLIQLWNFYDQAWRNKKSNRELQNTCHQHFLSYIRLREWRELYLQLCEIVQELELKLNQAVTDLNQQYIQIHRALLTGMLGNIGFKDGEAESYLGARGIRFHIAPGSALRKARPKWVMAAELIETSKLYGRYVAAIDPDWIEPLARHLTQSHYSDPRWDRKAAQVQAWERVSLYGLTIIPKRRVHYGPINAEESREIFIREALANREYDTQAAFFRHNQQLIAEIEALEHKARRQDVLVDEHALFAFYDGIIPSAIYNGASFEKWRKDIEQQQPRLLYLSKEYLMRHGASAVTEVQFPEQIILSTVTIPLKYRFEPGHALDGVTATIPLALLNQIDYQATEWLVPGMIREKLAALIKSLPKTIRRVCVPVPEFVTKFLSQADMQQALIPSLVEFIAKQTGLKLGLDDFDLTSLPAHLRMNFSVIDVQGKELGMGRDWKQLQSNLSNAAQLTFRQQTPEIEKTGLKQWDFGDIPETITFQRDGLNLQGYPALEDQQDAVAIKLFDQIQTAQQAHRLGVCRLMRFELKEQMKQLERGLPQFNQYALQLRQLISPDDLREQMLSAISDRAFIGEDEVPRTNAAFMQLKQRARARLPAVVDASVRLMIQIGQEYPLLMQKLNALSNHQSRLKRDLEQQLGQLLAARFLTQTPWERLQHLPRYLQAMRMRIEKYANSPDRDQRHAEAIQAIWQRWQQKIQQLQQAQREIPQGLLDYRWLIEELRVSLFAQELKTPFPVSVKRLDKIWDELKI
jgi:ATP-dependent helicase HrpA